MTVFATRRILAMMAAALGFNLAADVVHVYEETLVDGVRTQIGDRSLATGGDYVSDEAPTRVQHIFTGWSTAANQDFASRDVLGRSFDAVPFHLYESMTLTANYVPEALDEDADGIPDGYELYWYGDLSFGPDDDTDGDGLTFAQEVASGTNPLIADMRLSGVVSGETDLLSYGEDDAMTVVIRSEPEGVLFQTEVLKVAWGDTVSTEEIVGSLEGTDFYCWTMYGWEDRDSLGRARDNLEYELWDEYVEFVALTEPDPNDRAKLYWYGTTDVADSSDTDGDGYTFAQEIANGTNPLVADSSLSGVVSGESRLLPYSPFGYKCVFRCEPEGAFFTTVSENQQAGSEVSTEDFKVGDGFCCWTVDGVEQRDSLGRACDVAVFVMPEGDVEVVAKYEADASVAAKLYWYGRDDIADDSDTDGDGCTFAEEMSLGTNPLIPERSLTGVASGGGAMVEVNLQQYEQVVGALVDGKYEEFFTSLVAGNGATSRTFGPNLKPVVIDVNDDGLFDIVLVSGDRMWTYLNDGGESNPQFVESADGVPGWMPLDMGDPANIPVSSLDVPPSDALSVTWGDADQDGITDMLVSDADGRIWYYKGLPGDARSRKYELQHKVWGGSSEGFANGLRLAAVDWDDDGDLDCLCGTAEGKLILLRNPKVGRPTNVKALVGVDNVLLEWDPNAQSRVRGYRVYRGETAPVGEDADGTVGVPIAEPVLPRYRDYPPTIADFDYRITSVSRFYTAGNSTPIESESMPTDAVRAEFGKVKLAWNDASGFDNEEIKVSLGIENSLNVSGDGLTFEIAYDATALKPVRVETSGLTEGVAFTQSAEGGTWTVRATGGEVAAGGGKLFTFVFEPVGASETGVSVSSASMKSVGGATIPVVLPEGSAKVTVAPFVEPEPAHASVTMTESAQVTAGESFEVAVAVSGEGVDAASLAYDFSYDTTLFTRSGNVFTAVDVAEARVSTITLTNVSVKATDGTVAVVDSIGSCAVAIAPQAGGDVGSDGDEVDDPEQGVVYDKDGELVDWGDEPQEGSAAYGFGFRLVNMSLGSVRGKTDEIVEVSVGIHAIHLLLSTTVDVSRWAFSVCYDADLLEPVGIAAVQGEYDWSAANGVMTVVGKSGKLALGKMLSPWQYPLKLKFRPVVQYARHDADLRFKAVQGRTVEGKRIYTPMRVSGGVYIEFVRLADDPTVVVPYGRGDVTGDGRLAKDDLQLMAQLMQSKKEKWNDRQLGAGDYNGNGKLDNDDYQLMRADFRAKGIVNGGEKMGGL